MSYKSTNHTIRHAATMNGPNGTSLFIVYELATLPRAIPHLLSAAMIDGSGRSMPTLTSAPSTKERTSARNPPRGPRSQPMLRASFASARPIHLPPESAQRESCGAPYPRIGHYRMPHIVYGDSYEERNKRETENHLHYGRPRQDKQKKTQRREPLDERI